MRSVISSAFGTGWPPSVKRRAASKPNSRASRSSIFNAAITTSMAGLSLRSRGQTFSRSSSRRAARGGALRPASRADRSRSDLLPYASCTDERHAHRGRDHAERFAVQPSRDDSAGAHLTLGDACSLDGFSALYASSGHGVRPGNVRCRRNSLQRRGAPAVYESPYSWASLCCRALFGDHVAVRVHKRIKVRGGSLLPDPGSAASPGRSKIAPSRIRCRSRRASSEQTGRRLAGDRRPRSKRTRPIHDHTKISPPTILVTLQLRRLALRVLARVRKS